MALDEFRCQAICHIQDGCIEVGGIVDVEVVATLADFQEGGGAGHGLAESCSCLFVHPRVLQRKREKEKKRKREKEEKKKEKKRKRGMKKH